MRDEVLSASRHSGIAPYSHRTCPGGGRLKAGPPARSAQFYECMSRKCANGIFVKRIYKYMELNRKSSVAPMMDWTGEVRNLMRIRRLGAAEMRRSLYVAAARRYRWTITVRAVALYRPGTLSSSAAGLPPGKAAVASFRPWPPVGRLRPEAEVRRRRLSGSAL